VKEKTAIIIGAGPAGLTAGLELIRRSEIRPILLEASQAIGGLSRTVNYRGNRMDIGGHRFFSKSDRVMQWWLDILPIECQEGEPGVLGYQGKTREIPPASPLEDGNAGDRVMLVRTRKSRIYFLRRFFDYPVRLNVNTLAGLGPMRTLSCGLSYLWSTLMPRREERTLEDFLINRFGRRLYRMFYKSYTEKVWGVSCREMSAEWGAQRIKGLSLKSVVSHQARQILGGGDSRGIAQKKTETSLIEKFLYPKLGAGQLWERAAELICQGGGEIHLGATVDRIHIEGEKIVAVEATSASGQRATYQGEHFISTMPVRDLIRAMGREVPEQVTRVSEDLRYRDFIIVGLLATRLAITEEDGSRLRDTWIYIQEPEVKAGRLQIFNNWSPWLVSRRDRIWIGLEYFCNESDAIWQLSDAAMTKLAVEEAAKVGILAAADVEDSHVVREPKAYPAYFGGYEHFDEIRRYLDGFSNLFAVGRNGMHKYNNQDHSMLTAMAAVENILGGVAAKDNLWEINTGMEYHEENPAEETARRIPGNRADLKAEAAGTAVE